MLQTSMAKQKGLNTLQTASFSMHILQKQREREPEREREQAA